MRFTTVAAGALLAGLVAAEGTFTLFHRVVTAEAPGTKWERRGQVSVTGAQAEYTGTAAAWDSLLERGGWYQVLLSSGEQPDADGPMTSVRAVSRQFLLQSTLS